MFATVLPPTIITLSVCWGCVEPHFIQALEKVFHHIARETLERTPIPLGDRAHPYQPGDEIWVKD